MSELVQERQTRKPANIVAIVLIAFIIVMLSITGYFTYSVLSDSSVYKGIYVNGIAAGGLTEEALAAELENSFKTALDDTEIVLRSGDQTENLTYLDIGARYDTAAAAHQAYLTGRSGNVFQRLYEIVKAGLAGRHIEFDITYDEESLAAVADEFYQQTFVKVKEPEVLITEDSVTIQGGIKGKNIDREALLTEIQGLLAKHTGGTIELPLLETEPGKLNVDELYAQINREPADASFKVENNVVTVLPHIMGRGIERPALADAVKKTEDEEGSSITLPAVTSLPSITYELARAKMFTDTLGTANTRFSTSTQNDKNRGENIKIGVSKLHGKIIAPGESFSFNQTVGPRTEANGFKVANTYLNGKIVPDTGGGICQVSSTLYNSVLFADLQVLERRNHSLTVGYVPYGQDATVSYNDVDFKFKNNTRWPVKIEAWVTNDNNVYFSLKGTNEAPGKVVTVTPKTIKTTDFTIKYINDPNMYEGETRVKQRGMKGYTVETYKTVKQDGEIVSNTKLHTSVYRPLQQEVIRGTKKAPEAPPPAVAEDDTVEPVPETETSNPDNAI